jgi:hypothetical protein
VREHLADLCIYDLEGNVDDLIQSLQDLKIRYEGTHINLEIDVDIWLDRFDSVRKDITLFGEKRP